ncbi:MAG: acetamidase [Actinomycetia bacterium]|nr:acetamidase [Actinomycetes bacterium]
MILQPGTGPIRSSHYLPATAETISWGIIPTAESEPRTRVRSGDTVTIDTVSHEGVLDDFGRDPVGWFGAHGVPRDEVLHDAVDIATNAVHPPGAGPHVITGPIHVEGAEPGDVLVVDVLDVVPRVPYGVISNRHGMGVLSDEYPLPGADGRIATVSVFARTNGTGPVDAESSTREPGSGAIAYGDGKLARFPLAPFMGVMGIARAAGPVSSTPPGDFGGNIDVKYLQCGSRLYLPVQIPGAGFYAGDPHFAQGNGEVCLTALEGSLRGDVRLAVLRGAEARALGGLIGSPLVETDEHWIPIGIDADLDQALVHATRNAVRFLEERFGMEPHLAYAYLSAAADFEISQAVNRVKGVHCKIRKRDFEP